MNVVKPLTNHLVQQLTVAFSEKHAQVEDFGNVKEEIVVNDFSEDGWGEIVFLSKTNKPTICCGFDTMHMTIQLLSDV